MAKRETGFYWVITNLFNEWEVAKYDSEYDRWYLVENSEAIEEHHLQEINEDRIKQPNEL